jgi:hypothetical protein
MVFFSCLGACLWSFLLVLLRLFCNCVRGPSFLHFVHLVYASSYVLPLRCREMASTTSVVLCKAFLQYKGPVEWFRRLMDAVVGALSCACFALVECDFIEKVLLKVGDCECVYASAVSLVAEFSIEDHAV